MSICAIIPVASSAAANAALEAQGFGIGNFSVPAYGATGATHAALHAWGDPPFNAAVKAIAGVVYAEGTGDPVARTKALIEAQAQSGVRNSPSFRLPARCPSIQCTAGTATSSSSFNRSTARRTQQTHRRIRH